MALAHSLPDLRKDLRQLLVDGELPTAFTNLDELLPDLSEKKAIVTALRADLNQLNKDFGLGVIDPAEYGKRLAQINARFNSLLDSLLEADFEPPAAAPAPSGPPGIKTGTVLYKIPRQMPIRKPATCTIRVAVEEAAIFNDIVLDSNVSVRKQVEVSDTMTAELMDVSSNAFEVVALNSLRQKVRDTGYTQWVFRVTPLIEGEHELMVRVSLMEFDENTKEYVPREVSILEKVTIVTEAPAPSDSDDTPLRPAGLQVVLGPAEQAPNGKPQEANSKGQAANKPLRAMALFLAFVMLGSATTWAAIPPAVRDWWVAAARDTAEGYAAYIEKHRNSGLANPRLEKAYFHKADKTKALTDLRIYQDRYPMGLYEQEVLGKIAQLEGAAVTEIQKQPNAQKIGQFLADFPDAERLPEVKQAAEQMFPGQRAALLPALETGYVRTMQLRPSLSKLEQYLRDFPQPSRLTDMAETVCPLAAVLPGAQPILDKALEEKVQAAATLAEIQALLLALQAGSSRQAAERVAQIVAKKPAAISKPLAAEMQRLPAQVEQRQCALQLSAAAAHTAETASSLPGAGTASQNPDSAKPAPGTAAAPSEKVPAIAGTAPTNTGTALPSNPVADSDGDGTPDSADQCPNEKGAAVDKGCPPSAAQPTASRKSGLNMVRVAGGTFTMGSHDAQANRRKDECPHSVTVASFSIGQYEVTQADWREVMGSDPAHNKGCDDCPVENVSWNDAQKFIETLNKASSKKYRLPTEAEWEYAARGGAQSRGYEYAGSDRPNEVAWFGRNYKAGNFSGSQKTTWPVGSKTPNELRLYDMSGNVWEWCDDLYRAYLNCEATFDESQPRRVLRGGSWLVLEPDCSAAHRFGGGAAARNNSVGFRLAAGE